MRKPTVGWLAIPPLIYLFAFFIVPLGLLIVQSVFLPEFSLEKYEALLTVSSFRRGLTNSLEIAAWTTALTAIIGCVVLVGVFRAGRRMRSVLLAVLLMPFAANELVRIVSWVVFLSPAGPVNGLAQLLPWVDGPVSLVKNRAGVLIGLVHVLLPFFVLTAYGALRSIDMRLLRAAESLGARPVSAFLTVFVPLAMPGITAAALLVFVLSLGYYATPAALGGSSDTVLPTLIATRVRDTVDWGQAAALGVLLLAVTMLALAMLAKVGGLRVLYANTGPTGGGGSLSQAWSGIASSRVAMRLASAIAEAPRIRSALRWIHAAFVVAIVAYLITPIVVAIPASFTSGRILRFPPDGLSLRWYEDFFSRATWTEGTTTSLQVGLLVAVLTVALGVSAAIGLVRGARRRSQLLSFYLMPLIMPSIVTALAMFLLFNTLGLAYTPIGIALGHAVFAFPYTVLVLVAAFQSFDWELDRAAQASGARWWSRMRDVIFPLLRPAILTGLLFAFVVSFTELVFALFMGSLSVTTLPVTMWAGIRYEVSPTTAAAASLVVSGIGLLYLGFIGARFATRLRGRARGEVGTVAAGATEEHPS